MARHINQNQVGPRQEILSCSIAHCSYWMKGEMLPSFPLPLTKKYISKLKPKLLLHGKGEPSYFLFYWLYRTHHNTQIWSQQCLSVGALKLGYSIKEILHSFSQLQVTFFIDLKLWIGIFNGCQLTVASSQLQNLPQVACYIKVVMLKGHSWYSILFMAGLSSEWAGYSKQRKIVNKIKCLKARSSLSQNSHVWTWTFSSSDHRAMVTDGCWTEPAFKYSWGATISALKQIQDSGTNV